MMEISETSYTRKLLEAQPPHPPPPSTYLSITPGLENGGWEWEGGAYYRTELTKRGILIQIINCRKKNNLIFPVTNNTALYLTNRLSIIALQLRHCFRNPNSTTKQYLPDRNKSLIFGHLLLSNINLLFFIPHISTIMLNLSQVGKGGFIKSVEGGGRGGGESMM